MMLHLIQEFIMMKIVVKIKNVLINHFFKYLLYNIYKNFCKEDISHAYIKIYFNLHDYIYTIWM